MNSFGGQRNTGGGVAYRTSLARPVGGQAPGTRPAAPLPAQAVSPRVRPERVHPLPISGLLSVKLGRAPSRGAGQFCEGRG